MCTLTCGFQTSLHNPLITCQDMYIDPGWEVGVMEAAGRGMPRAPPCSDPAVVTWPCSITARVTAHEFFTGLLLGAQLTHPGWALGLLVRVKPEVLGSVTHVPINTTCWPLFMSSIHPPLPHPT